MFNYSDLAFWNYFLFFFVSVFFAFFIPGDLFLKKLSLNFFQRLVLGTVLGMVLWGFQGFILGYLNLRQLSYLYLLVTFIIWLGFNVKDLFRFSFKIKLEKADLLLGLLILIGTIIQLSSIWFNGFLYLKNLYFCCANTSDSLYHIALTHQIINNIPPQEPGMVGMVVQNYHYLGNLVVAELVRVFNLPLIHTQYQYSTFLISVLFGFSVLIFVQTLKLKRPFSFWLLFFLYFGGDLIYLLLLILGKGFSFNMSSLEDGTKFLVNPPRAYSLVIFFAALSLFSLWIKKRDKYTGIIMAVLFGSLVGFKIYTGIFALSGLGVLGIYLSIIKKRLDMLPPILLSFLISLLIYLPSNSGAGGLYFTGFWLFENFIVQSSLSLDRVELARRVYLDHNNWIKVTLYEGIYFLVYLFFIFGSKVVGIFQTKKSLSVLPLELSILLLTGLGVSAIAGFFFQQSAGGANTFNFLVSLFIIGSIYSALACYYWLNKIKHNGFKAVLIFIIILITIPRVIFETGKNFVFIAKNEGFTVTNGELEALDYLKNNTPKSSVIMIDSRDFDMTSSTPYMSFLIDRPIFLSGEGILESHRVDTSSRAAEIKYVVHESDYITIEKLLKKNKINYIFMSSRNKLPVEKYAKYLKVVFKNNKVRILKVED